LIEAVAKIGVERNCGRFEWTALNWNEKALGFYDKLGARKMDEWIMLRMDAEQMRELDSQSKGIESINLGLRGTSYPRKKRMKPLP
jgi:RimJ/RimL family protein N-acetyltransferase